MSLSGRQRTTTASQPNTRLGWLLLWVLVLSVAIALGFLPASPALGDAPPQTVYKLFHIDRSAVPAWVTHHALTLRIQVGDAEEVRAWADGKPASIAHDPATGTLLVTTTAENLLIAAQGEGLSPEDVGAFTIAPIKDDKRWAFSLTLDDGEISVYSYALPELQHYGYRAATAAIGIWLDAENPENAENPNYVAMYPQYCHEPELLALIDEGWSIFNHSYLQSGAPSDINYESAETTQRLIEDKLNGFKCSVFTVPLTSPEIDALWIDAIDHWPDALGLYLMQLSTGGGGLSLVDLPLELPETLYHMGRANILDWMGRNGHTYFEEAHAYAMQTPAQHTWVSLHGHNIQYDKDWPALADALATLYNIYGGGGPDEVWVAPADVVFQYQVVRSYAEVTVSEGTPSSG